MTDLGDIVVPIRRAPEHDDLSYPTYATDGASGVDLVAAVPADAPMVIRRGEISLVPTGISLAVPRGFEAQVRARSGLALRHGLTLVNAPGTIDSDYRGEIKIILTTLAAEDFVIERGLRVAQLCFCPVARVRFDITDELPETRRGDGGFGHTGLTTKQ